MFEGAFAQGLQRNVAGPFVRAIWGKDMMVGGPGIGLQDTGPVLWLSGHWRAWRQPSQSFCPSSSELESRSPSSFLLQNNPFSPLKACNTRGLV